MNITKRNVAVFAKDSTMSSYEFWRVLNDIRKDRGASDIRHDQFLERVIDECNLSNCKSFAVKNLKGNKRLQAYNLDMDQMLLVGMRESKVIRKQVLKWLHDLTDKVAELEKEKAYKLEASLSFKEQSAALKLSRELEGKKTLSFHYSNEADLLNRVILGCTAKSYRIMHNLEKSDSLRDTLTTVELEAFIALRKANENYLLDGDSYEERKEKLYARYMKFFNQRLIDEMHLIG